MLATPESKAATLATVEGALGRVLRSENAHFGRIWERAPRSQRLLLEALARAPGQPVYSSAYRRQHNLPATATVQKAIDALVEDQLAERYERGFRVAEPFLAEWILREDV